MRRPRFDIQLVVKGLPYRHVLEIVDCEDDGDSMEVWGITQDEVDELIAQLEAIEFGRDIVDATSQEEDS